VLADLRGARPGARVLGELESERFEGASRFTAEQAAPPPHHLARQAAKSQDVRVAHIAETPAPMARHGMTDEVEQTHQGEEGLACHLARAEGAV